MNEKNKKITKTVVKIGGWQVAKRVAKRIPIIGTVLTIGLVGNDVRKKGIFKGVANSALDIIPFVGTAKGIVEIFTGDLISDKQLPEKRFEIKKG
jgi:hypothetical protein